MRETINKPCVETKYTVKNSSGISLAEVKDLA